MIQELVYTSAPRGLEPGSKGFCTVACTAGMSPNVAKLLEQLSAYRHLFPPRSSDGSNNPTSYRFLRAAIGGKRLLILSRVADAGLDYSGRTNKIAHHIALDETDIVRAGPAWLLSQPNIFIEAWEGEPRRLAPRTLPDGSLDPGPCVNWKRITGDAGNAGLLLRAAVRHEPCEMLFSPEMDVLSLILDVQALLPPKDRWSTTFSTYHSQLPPNVECHWKAILRNSQEAQSALNLRPDRTLDLTSRIVHVGHPYADAAREGRYPSTNVDPEKSRRSDIREQFNHDSDLVASISPPSLLARGNTGVSKSLEPKTPPRLNTHGTKRRWTLKDTSIVALSIVLIGTVIWIIVSPRLGKQRHSPVAEDSASDRVAVNSDRPSDEPVETEQPDTVGAPGRKATTAASQSASNNGDSRGEQPKSNETGTVVDEPPDSPDRGGSLPDASGDDNMKGEESSKGPSSTQKDQPPLLQGHFTLTPEIQNDIVIDRDRSRLSSTYGKHGYEVAEITNGWASPEELATLISSSLVIRTAPTVRGDRSATLAFEQESGTSPSLKLVWMPNEGGPEAIAKLTVWQDDKRLRKVLMFEWMKKPGGEPILSKSELATFKRMCPIVVLNISNDCHAIPLIDAITDKAPSLIDVIGVWKKNVPLHPSVIGQMTVFVDGWKVEQQDKLPDNRAIATKNTSLKIRGHEIELELDVEIKLERRGDLDSCTIQASIFNSDEVIQTVNDRINPKVKPNVGKKVIGPPEGEMRCNWREIEVELRKHFHDEKFEFRLDLPVLDVCKPDFVVPIARFDNS